MIEEIIDIVNKKNDFIKKSKNDFKILYGIRIHSHNIFIKNNVYTIKIENNIIITSTINNDFDVFNIIKEDLKHINNFINEYQLLDNIHTNLKNKYKEWKQYSY